MKKRGSLCLLWGAGVGLSLLSGCQTWVPEAALTLPSGYYLRHPPQYIPPSPQFPLARELASLEAATLQQAAPPLPVPPPAVVPPPALPVMPPPAVPPAPLP